MTDKAASFRLGSLGREIETMEQGGQIGTEKITVTIENLGGCKRLLRIEVASEKVKECYEKTLREFVKLARIPGFRPGKAPRQIVEKTFAEDLLYETRNMVIRESLKQALQKHSLRQLTREEIEAPEKLELDKAFVFTATMEVFPEIELPDYKEIPVVLEERKVTEADVERAFRVLQEEKATYEIVNRPIQEGDIAIINFIGSVDGKKFSQIKQELGWLDEQKGYWCRINPNEFLPGFALQLIGANAREKRTIKIAFPADYEEPALVNKEAIFEVEIIEVREKRLPALNDEFARSYGAKDLQQLRASVIEDLEKELVRTRKRKIREQIITTLLGRVNFELPETFVQLETRDLVYDIVKTHAERGFTKEQIDARKEEIYTLASRSARDRVKLRFLLSKIAEKEGVTVTNEELSTRVAILAQVYKIPIGKFVRELERTGGLHQIAEEIMMDKVLDLLEKYALIQTTPTT